MDNLTTLYVIEALENFSMNHNDSGVFCKTGIHVIFEYEGLTITAYKLITGTLLLSENFTCGWKGWGGPITLRWNRNGSKCKPEEVNTYIHYCIDRVIESLEKDEYNSCAPKAKRKTLLNKFKKAKVEYYEYRNIKSANY